MAVHAKRGLGSNAKRCAEALESESPNTTTNHVEASTASRIMRARKEAEQRAHEKMHTPR